METMRIRFVEAEGGHLGLINKCDLDYARHIPVDDEGNPLEESGGGNLDTTPGAIATVNVAKAKALIAKAEDAATLDALEADEKASVKNEGGRKGVLAAIEERRAELAK